MAENTLVDQQLSFILSFIKTGIDSGMLKIKNKREDYFDKASAELLRSNLGESANASLFEVKGMSSEELNIFFEYTGIKPISHRQMTDGTVLLAIDNNQIKRAYNLARKINKGEITFDELREILEKENSEKEEREEEKKPDTEHEEESEEREENDEPKPESEEKSQDNPEEVVEETEKEEEPDIWEDDFDFEKEKVLEEDKRTTSNVEEVPETEPEKDTANRQNKEQESENLRPENPQKSTDKEPEAEIATEPAIDDNASDEFSVVEEDIKENSKSISDKSEEPFEEHLYPDNGYGENVTEKEPDSYENTQSEKETKSSDRFNEEPDGYEHNISEREESDSNVKDASEQHEETKPSSYDDSDEREFPAYTETSDTKEKDVTESQYSKPAEAEEYSYGEPSSYEEKAFESFYKEENKQDNKQESYPEEYQNTYAQTENDAKPANFYAEEPVNAAYKNEQDFHESNSPVAGYSTEYENKNNSYPGSETSRDYSSETTYKENNSYQTQQYQNQENVADTFDKEKRQQEEIVRRTEAERVSHENVTVYNRGNAETFENYSSSDYKSQNATSRTQGYSSGNNYPSPGHSDTYSQTASSANGGYGDNENKMNIQFNKMNLVNEHYHSKDTSVIEKMGETVTRPIEGRKETATYKGYESVTNVTSTIGLLACSSTGSNVGILEAQKLHKYQKDNGFASLNKMLDEKKVAGFYNNNSIYGLKNGLDFSTLDNANNSREALLRYLEKKGLVHYDKSKYDKGGWDTKKLDELIKHGRTNDIAKILKLSPNMPESQRRAIIADIEKIARGANLGKEASNIRRSSGKRLLNNMLKDSKDNATYRGYADMAKTTRLARKAIKVSAMALAMTGRKLMGVPTGIVRHTPLKHTKVGQKILNKETKIQRLNERIRKIKENRINRKSDRVTAKIKKKQDRIKKRELEKLKRYKNKYGAREGIRRFQKAKAVRRRANKVAGFAKGIMDAPGALLTKLFSALNSIKRKFLILVGGAFGVFLLLMIVNMLITAFVTTISSFFSFEKEKQDTSVMGVFESEAGVVLQNLISAESQWVNGLKTITEQDINLNDLKYGTDSYYTFEQYCNMKGLKTEGRNVIAPNPFGEEYALPDGMYKRISQPDFSELEFENASGGYTRTSNIKEILSLCAVYFENNDDVSEFKEDIVEVSDSFWVNAKNALASVGKSIYSWTIQPIVDEIEKEESAYVMSEYCLTLFNVSHQEQFDLEVKILPTKQQLLEAGGETALQEAIYCPDETYDGYGCMTYDKFWYNNHKLYVDSDSGAAVDVTGKVHMIDENDDCSLGDSSNVNDFENVYLSHEDCWTYTQSTEYYGKSVISNEWEEEESSDSAKVTTVYHEMKEAAAVGSAFADKIQNICNANGYKFTQNALNITKINNNTYKVMTGSYATDEEFTEETIQIKDGIRYKVTTKYKKIYQNFLTFTHECDKKHSGSYCGGHLTMNVKGIIYGLTDDEIASMNDSSIKFNVMVPDIYGEYTRPSVTQNEIDTARFPLMKLYGDIFYADSTIKRSVTPESWEGWTKDNMDLAIIKYGQDWEDLYGITIASSLGGNAVSAVDKKEILATLKTNYPSLSQERLDVISEGLDWVGNMGYSQAHHNCKLEGPCRNRSDGQACHLSDCSGFTSNLWRNRFGGNIYSTVGFKSAFQGTSKWRGLYNSSTITPGDIIIHYDYSADGAHHALLYLGKIYPDSDDEYSIDCSTVDGVGNVFLRHRSYYPDCYVVAPDR